MNMFEQASRLCIRFDSPRGALSVEDLWTLPLLAASATRPSLDAIAVGLHKQTRDAAETVSFVAPATADSAKDELLLKFEVVKYIISVRVAERDAAAAAADRKEKKQRLLSLIAEKQDAELSSKSIDELRALAESM